MGCLPSCRNLINVTYHSPKTTTIMDRKENSVFISMTNMKCTCKNFSQCTVSTEKKIEIYIHQSNLTIPSEVFTLCEGKMTSCIKSVLKRLIKEHLQHVYFCQHFSGAEVTCIWPESFTISTDASINKHVLEDEPSFMNIRH